MAVMKNSPWQLILIKLSIKKKQKLRFILDSLSANNHRQALELGTSQGALGYFFRQKGGFWIHADEDWPNLVEAKNLLKINLVQLKGSQLPFQSESFDLVISPDYLEHLDNDQLCLEEMARILKPGGQAIIVTPHRGPGNFLYQLRSWLGLRPEFYGHKRDGYNFLELTSQLQKAGLKPEDHKIISRLFSESLELILNFIYIHIFGYRPKIALRNGHIRPMNQSEFKKVRPFHRIYSWLYPFFWLAAQLDNLISFSPGYLLIVWARKK
ncbi:MAG: class I SAM-dependent methyltransferase [Candidatus Aminicenantes bacterium]|nr:class I SAM-dependent methyltransferase [Candidatus Aminicenantes bacterium]